jgi:hypothetical protein
MKYHLIILGCCASVLAGQALAQTTDEQTTVVEKKSGGTAAGALAGAATGAVVAGPVGAVVGGIAGAAVGHSVAPPTEVRTYVTRQDVRPVTYGRAVEVGQPIDAPVTWMDIPDYPKYRWAYLDGHRVVVDSDSHKVVAVY